MVGGMGETRAVASQEWLFGPVRDLLFGCGLAYAGLLAIVGASGATMRSLSVWFSFLGVAFSLPHYGATIVRVYEKQASVKRYVVFSVYATVTLLLLLGLATHSAPAASLLVTVYLTWSPWHYTGQNYGLAMMFLRRRNIPVSPVLRRLLHASFVLSFATAMIPVHMGAWAPNNPVGVMDSAVVRFIPLGIPQRVGSPLFLLTAIACAAALVATVALMIRAAGAVRPLVPSLCILGTQAVWFSIPALLKQRFPSVAGAVGEPVQAFIWIAVGHAVQYLWVTSYYAKKSASAEPPARFLLKALAAGGAVWAFPVILFAPGALGRLPYDLGLGVAVGSVVNLHHFILDGAIWKLRDGRIARILIQNDKETDASSSRPVKPWIVRFAWGTAALGLLLYLVSTVSEDNWKSAVASGNVARVERYVGLFSLVGQDMAALHIELGRLKAQRGDIGEALDQFRAANDLAPTWTAWFEIGRLQEQTASWEKALAAYDSAIALRPDNEKVLRRRASVLRRLGMPEAADLRNGPLR